MINQKKAQGEVVAVMLLILLTIAAVVILMGFVIPWIKYRLDKSCFDYNGMIEIKNDEKYTCYDNTAHRLVLKISLGDLKKDIVKLKGFEIIVNTENHAQERFTITKTSASLGVTPFGPGLMDIPEESGSGRTYNFTLNNGNIRPNSTMIYPLLENEKECSEQNYFLDSIPYC